MLTLEEQVGVSVGGSVRITNPSNVGCCVGSCVGT